MSQGLRMFLCNLDDLIWFPSTHLKHWAWLYKPVTSLLWGRDTNVPRTSWSASLVGTPSFCFSDPPCLKAITLLHVFTDMNMPIHVHYHTSHIHTPYTYNTIDADSALTVLYTCMHACTHTHAHTQHTISNWMFLFCFCETEFFCSFGACLGTHSVDQAGFELRDPPASASWVLGLKV